jgi:uncharacterized protein (DUF433 family)
MMFQSTLFGFFLAYLAQPPSVQALASVNSTLKAPLPTLVPPVSSLKMRVMSEPLIVVDPEIMNGTPCFRGTRVPFKNLIDYLEGGHPLDEFLRQFPTVTREMAVRALGEAKP